MNNNENFPGEQISMPKNKQLLIMAFVLLYFATAIVSLLPHSPWQSQLLRVFSPLETALGIRQRWSLFSPELRTFNFHPEAIITFDDGSIKIYEFPYPPILGFWKAFQTERMHKFLYDSFPWADSKSIFPDSARYIAHLNNYPGKKPVLVSLGYHWIEIPDFNHWVEAWQLPEHTKRYTYFVYKVHPEDLNPEGSK